MLAKFELQQLKKPPQASLDNLIWANLFSFKRYLPHLFDVTEALSGKSTVAPLTKNLNYFKEV